MAQYKIKIVSEDRRKPEEINDKTPDCGSCAKLQKKIKAVTCVRVGFTWMRGEDSFADLCVTHRKELGQLISGRILVGEWPDHMTGNFWTD